MRTKKKLALLLIFALLLTMVCPTYSAEAAKSKKQNAITELGIARLPKNNTIKVGSYFNFNPDIISTELGKGKTTGLVYWEVNTQTNTAGVTSSRWGYVYPVYAGSFEIRAVAFANSKDMSAWKNARSVNGYVESAEAGEKYVTAYSDWVTIQVVADEEGYAVARTQYQLNLALKNKNATDIHIVTNKARTFTIKSANYTGKTLTVQAPNSDVVNSGRFVQINVEQIKASTFYEKGWGNRFLISAPNASFHVEESARVQNLEFAPAAANAKINIVGNGGRINNIDIAAAGEVKISGKTSAGIPVTVKETAAGTTIDTEIKLVIDVNASVELNAAKEATETVINLLKAVEAAIRGEAEKIAVNVDEAAEGAVIKSETKLEIDADASVSVELAAGAEGTTVKADENAAVTVKNDTTEEVVIADKEGNETVAKPGEEAVMTTAPEPTEAPSITETPSTSGGTSSGGSTSSGGNTSGGTTTSPSETPTPTEEPSETPAPTEEPSETPTPTEEPSETAVTVTWTGVAEGSQEFSLTSETEIAKIVILEAGTTGTITFVLNEGSTYTLTTTSLNVSGMVSTFTVEVKNGEDGEAVTLGKIHFVLASTPELKHGKLSNNTVSGSSITVSESSINVSNGAATLTVVTGASVSVQLTESAYTDDMIEQLKNIGIELAYQWYENDSEIAGATAKSYTVTVDNTESAAAVTKVYHVVVKLSTDAKEIAQKSSKGK